MAEGKALRLNSKHHTYLSKRFDRTADGQHLHFASAMTLLQHIDGDDYTSGASYLEMVDFILRHGARPNIDLEELWRRIVFSICVKNTDDHLRNHGFILTTKGWVLSPAYDVNPNPEGDGLRLNISENDNSPDIELAMSVIKHFRLEKTRAQMILTKVNESVSSWKKLAEEYQVSGYEQNMMARSFLS